MSLLSSFPGEGETRNTLEMCINGEVRSQDAPYLAGGAMFNRHHGILSMGVHQISLGRDARHVSRQQRREDGKRCPSPFQT